jgi:FkbM family methyltransferase
MIIQRLHDALIHLLPWAYRRSGLKALASTRVGRGAFLAVYQLYKRWIEDPHAGLARRHPELFRGGDVLDVGANVGYTARVFAKVVDPGQRVYAFEPDERNFAALSKAARRVPSIVPVHSAVGDTEGTATLRVNPDHPGDHQIVTATGPDPDVVPVPITTLDAFRDREMSGRRVCFVKVDVQGFELAVCRGMEGLLAADDGIVVSFEYTGPTSDDVLAFFRDRGFHLYLVDHSGGLTELAGRVPDDAWLQRGYCDLLASRAQVQTG